MSNSLTRRSALGSAVAAAAAMATTGPAQAASRPERLARVFISSNANTGNEIVVYSMSEAGTLAALARHATGGAGTSGGLGSQGAVTVSRNGRYLFVVNAGSGTVSAFKIGRDELELASVVDSGGAMPTSVAEHGGVVYVLNAGGNGNVSGYRNRGGRLEPIANSIRALSAAGGTAPGQVGFSDDGETLVVSERATNVLTSWRMRDDGTLDQRVVTRSPGATPFGFAFTRRNRLVVSEAAGGAPSVSSVSSYRIADESPGVLNLVTAALSTTQTAACWISVTPDGRYAYSANAGSSSVSLIRVGRRAELTLVEARAGLTGPGAGALDMVVSPSGEWLHVFASRALQIVSFSIADNGHLALAGSIGGVTAGSAGLAAV